MRRFVLDRKTLRPQGTAERPRRQLRGRLRELLSRHGREGRDHDAGCDGEAEVDGEREVETCMAGLVRHRQTKVRATDGPDLNHRVISRLYRRMS
jgi:hypothetical protein